MSAEIIVIPVFNDAALRLHADLVLREQYFRECDALERSWVAPPPRTRPIALPSRLTQGLQR